MKKNIPYIVFLIAFVAITVFAKKSLVFLLLMSLLLGIAEWYESKNNPKKAAPEPAPEPEGIETAIDKDLVQYGEPDDIIVIDPARGKGSGIVIAIDNCRYYALPGFIQEITNHIA